ncbi:MAG: aminopeptidase [Lachnospiraceae bacterium]|nr:aminopeptidase [Lachnospiraceae bacterium]
MNHKLLEKYVELIIRKGINIQPKQQLLIICPIECAWFAHELMKAAYSAESGEVFIRWIDDEGERIRYIHAPDYVFTSYPEWNKLMMNKLCKEKAAVISILSTDPSALQGVSQERIQQDMQSAQIALQYYRDSLMSNRTQWCVLSIPSPSWAQKIFPNLEVDKAMEKLWEKIFLTSHIDRNDPINNWNIHIKELEVRLNILNKYNFKELIFENSLGTKLTLELVKGHIWTGGSERTLEDKIEFIANIPTEEIFTTPKRDGVNGVVYATKPLIYMGDIIEDFVIEFDRGKVINVSARKNQKLLEKLVSSTFGTNFLGEVALVPYDSPVSKSEIIFYNSLYDENASCHLALGKAYPSTVKGTEGKSEEELLKMGVNCSMEHEDFMIGSDDMNITGIMYNGKKIPIFINGNFVF